MKRWKKWLTSWGQSHPVAVVPDNWQDIPKAQALTQLVSHVYGVGGIKAYMDGFTAFYDENRTGDLVYNPHDPDTPQHQFWDYGYEDAGHKPLCRTCSNDNEAYRMTFFDQTCPGCVSRMTA